MHSSAPILASNTDHDSNGYGDDEFSEALDGWSLQDFADILGGHPQ